MHARREPGRELPVQPVREDRAEDRDPDRAADLPEEERARGRDAHVAVVDSVLHREHEHLHDRAEPEAEHDHRHHQRGQARLQHRQHQVLAQPHGREAVPGDQGRLAPVAVTPAIRASSRASAPKPFTVGLDEIESASAPPIRESSATERRLACRT